MNNRFFVFCLFLMLGLLACNSEPEVSQTPNKSTNSPNSTTDTDTTPKETPKKRILFFGNSLTAAYGLDPSEGFVGIIDKKLDSLNLPYRAINAGLSGETTAGGNSRIDWILDQQAFDIFILELGGNDGLRGINPKDTYQNLQSIIDKVRAKNEQIKIVLAGMEAPPNMGAEFTSSFRENYKRLASENNIALIPFLLEKVGGVKELNQRDGIHPTAEGHRIVADNIWEILKDQL